MAMNFSLGNISYNLLMDFRLFAYAVSMGAKFRDIAYIMERHYFSKETHKAMEKANIYFQQHPRGHLSKALRNTETFWSDKLVIGMITQLEKSDSPLPLELITSMVGMHDKTAEPEDSGVIDISKYLKKYLQTTHTATIHIWLEANMLLMEQGLSFLEALEITLSYCDEELKEEVSQLIDRMKEGNSAYEAMKESGILLPQFNMFVYLGEIIGDLFPGFMCAMSTKGDINIDKLFGCAPEE
jgi:type II secretory pathway component PulF